MPVLDGLLADFKLYEDKLIADSTYEPRVRSLAESIKSAPTDPPLTAVGSATLTPEFLKIMHSASADIQEIQSAASARLLTRYSATIDAAFDLGEKAWHVVVHLRSLPRLFQNRCSDICWSAWVGGPGAIGTHFTKLRSPSEFDYAKLSGKYLDPENPVFRSPETP